MSDPLVKIRALLAKAESTTPEEAELLSEKASELMLRYQVTEGMLSADPGQDRFTAIERRFNGSYAIARRRMLCSIANGLGAYPVYWSFQRYQLVTVHVWEKDAACTTLLLDSLEIQAASALDDWWRASSWQYDRNERIRARREFLEAFGAGARFKMLARRQHVDAVPGAALVLVERADRLKTAVRNAIGESTPGRASTAIPVGSFNAGFTAGQQADTGEHQLTAGASR